MPKASTNGRTNAVVRAMTVLTPFRQLDGVQFRVRIFSMEENIRTLYGVHVRHHHLNLIAQPVGCLYKVKIPVKIRSSDICGGSLIDVLGLNWNRQNGIMFECLELVKILKNPEDYLETLPTASICLKPKKESNPRVLENLSPSLW